MIASGATIAFFAAFTACFVEFVEAFTIVLAVGILLIVGVAAITATAMPSSGPVVGLLLFLGLCAVLASSIHRLVGEKRARIEEHERP